MLQLQFFYLVLCWVTLQIPLNFLIRKVVICLRPNGTHSYFDLVLKAEIAINNPEYLRIAVSADSPSSAEKIAKDKGYKAKIIKSIHAASRIKRDYQIKFYRLPQVENLLNNNSDLLIDEVLKTSYYL